MDFRNFAENLILTADQKTVKLVDFGLAREESLTEMMTAETGTYRWMAPEVLIKMSHSLSLSHIYMDQLVLILLVIMLCGHSCIVPLR